MMHIFSTALNTRILKYFVFTAYIFILIKWMYFKLTGPKSELSKVTDTTYSNRLYSVD